MHLYAVNQLIVEDKAAQLRNLVIELGKKASVRVVLRPGFISFSPPVNDYLIDLRFDENLKELGNSLKERLIISGFYTDLFTRQQLLLYSKQLKRLHFAIREGKPGVFYTGYHIEKKKARLLQQIFELRGYDLNINKLKLNSNRQIILQDEKDVLLTMEDALMEWFLQQAGSDAPVPFVPSSTLKVAEPKNPFPDPLDILNSPKETVGMRELTKEKKASSLDSELEGLPLGENLMNFLSSDDPRAKQLGETIKRFYEEEKKRNVHKLATEEKSKTQQKAP